MSTLTNPSLFDAIELAFMGRKKAGVPIRDISRPMPSSAPDLFSNDYLSLATDPHLRQIFLQRLSQSPYILGTGGTRLLTGSPDWLIELEERMQHHWNAPAALLCNSGFDANIAFFRTVPQKTDVVIFDELIHASIRDGLSASRASNALYAFAHSSIPALRERIAHVLEKHPDILTGKCTVFFALESAYSMDGDLAPLPGIVDLIEEMLPAGAAHIFVDEAHTTGVCGAAGRGLVNLLGLDTRVHTVLHTFSKALGFTGGLLLTAPIIKKYMANYSRPIIYSTSLPHCNIEAIHATLDYISSSNGAKLIQDVQTKFHYFEPRLIEALKTHGQTLLTLPPRVIQDGIPDDLVSPIFPLLTTAAIPLAEYLQSAGYDVQPIPYPAVPKGKERIRIIIHARNTHEDMDGLIAQLVEWIKANHASPPLVGVDEHTMVTPCVDAKALLVHTAAEEHLAPDAIASSGAPSCTTIAVLPASPLKVEDPTFLGGSLDLKAECAEPQSWSSRFISAKKRGIFSRMLGRA